MRPFSKISAKKDVEQHIRHTNTLVGLVSENFKDLHLIDFLPIVIKKSLQIP